jgi:putative SOS response-associated peptidase YedK
MCGRYIIAQSAKAVKEWEKYGPPPFLDSFNVAPTNPVTVLRVNDGASEYVNLRWGLIPFFARGVPPKFSTINARIETVETAPSYRGPWERGRRCLQLASGFYEWHVDATGRKAPFLVSLADQELFGFAALWDRSRTDDGATIESCAHITMPANEFMAQIHNAGANPYRMPAIIRPEDRDIWLNGSVEEARGVLKPYPSEMMSAYEVSARVNSVKNNSPELIEPAPRDDLFSEPVRRWRGGQPPETDKE